MAYYVVFFALLATLWGFMVAAHKCEDSAQAYVIMALGTLIAVIGFGIAAVLNVQ